jgi:hypothetical protein
MLNEHIGPQGQEQYVTHVAFATPPGLARQFRYPSPPKFSRQFAGESIMRTTCQCRVALFVISLVGIAAGCRNQGAQSDPFMQRRIIAPPPTASYGPPAVQLPPAAGVPALQPVPGPQPGSGQWTPTGANVPATALPGVVRPASATQGAGDGWVPADKPAASPDHSAAASPTAADAAGQPSVNPAQSMQTATASADESRASLAWTRPPAR